MRHIGAVVILAVAACVAARNVRVDPADTRVELRPDRDASVRPGAPAALTIRVGHLGVPDSLLGSARIHLERLPAARVADTLVVSGELRNANLPPGQYRVRVSRFGYKSVTVEFPVTSGCEVVVELELSSAYCDLEQSCREPAGRVLLRTCGRGP